MRKFAIYFMACLTVCAQQIDKPTTTLKDLGDQKEAARADATERLQVTEGAEPILRKKVGPNPGDDLLAEAPFIQLRLMTCLIKGDYGRRLSAIYSNAADAAASAAKEIDAKASAPVAPSAEAAKARQELNESIRREAELRARPTLNGVDKVELDGLPAYIQRLRETIAIYDEVEKSHSKGARTSEVANQMREREASLRILVKEADGDAGFFNAQCVSEGAQLERIDQLQRDKKMQWEYDRLTGGPRVPPPADKGGNGAVPTAATGTSDADKLKEDERILSDPDEMLKRADHLKQLNRQGN